MAQALPHAGRPGRFARGPGAPRHQPARPRRAAGPGHRSSCRSITSSSATHEHWFTTREELDEFVARAGAGDGQRAEAPTSEAAAGRRQRPTRRAADGQPNGNGQPGQPAAHRRAARSALDQQPCWPTCASMGFEIDSLIPAGAHRHRGAALSSSAAARTRSGSKICAACCRPSAAAGEQGLTITRFKGLGEMNAEELRDTTLDPGQPHAACKSRWKTPAPPTSLFRILMGDKVEPRREFIEKHALEVRNLDV